MKYTKEEVLDILKIFTDAPEEVLTQWETIKADTSLKGQQDRGCCSECCKGYDNEK